MWFKPILNNASIDLSCYTDSIDSRKRFIKRRGRRRSSIESFHFEMKFLKSSSRQTNPTSSRNISILIVPRNRRNGERSIKMPSTSLVGVKCSNHCANCAIPSIPMCLSIESQHPLHRVKQRVLQLEPPSCQLRYFSAILRALRNWRRMIATEKSRKIREIRDDGRTKFQRDRRRWQLFQSENILIFELYQLLRSFKRSLSRVSSGFASQRGDFMDEMARVWLDA